MRAFYHLMLWIAIGVAQNEFSNLLTSEWSVYKDTYLKNFTCKKEDVYRLKIYIEKRQLIIENNLKYIKNESTFLMNINNFTDRLKSEVVNTNGYIGIPNRTNNHVVNSDYPPEIDWRQKGCVGPVRDQGSCGSCYAITTAQCIEGQMLKYYKTLTPLSAQRFIDCSNDTLNSGCNGGLMTKSYQHVMVHKGLETENAYPYSGQQGVCKMNKTAFKMSVKNYTTIEKGNETALTHAVATIGPIAAGIDASQISLMSYCSGIYYDQLCSSHDVNHAVLLVGYGKTENDTYWIIKNSWGDTWGEGGFFRLRRGINHCGVAQIASYPETELPPSTTINQTDPYYYYDTDPTSSQDYFANSTNPTNTTNV